MSCVLPVSLAFVVVFHIRSFKFKCCSFEVIAILKMVVVDWNLRRMPRFNGLWDRVRHQQRVLGRVMITLLSERMVRNYHKRSYGEINLKVMSHFSVSLTQHCHFTTMFDHDHLFIARSFFIKPNWKTNKKCILTISNTHWFITCSSMKC